MKKYILNLIFLGLSFVILKPMFDLSSLTGPKNSSVEFIFRTDLQSRKLQLEDLDKNLIAFKKRFEEANKAIIRNIKSINLEINNVKDKIQAASYSQLEIFNKKVSLLNERKQNFKKLQELWKETQEIIEKHIVLVKDIIEIQQDASQKESLKLVYSWKDFQEAQNKIAELNTKIDQEVVKKDSSKKQKITEKETLISLQKQLENRGKDKESSVVLEQELNLINDKIDYINLKIENLDFLIKYKEDSISLNEYQLNQLNELLSQIEKKLSIDEIDVENAKLEWENEDQKAFKIKNQLIGQIDLKKLDRDKVNLELETAKEDLKKIKSDSSEINKYFIETKIQKIEAVYVTLLKEIQLLDLKIELEEILSKNKKLEYEVIDTYSKLNTDKVSLDYFLTNFKNQQELLVSSIKLLKDKLKSENDFLLEVNRNLDSLKRKKEDLINKKKFLSEENSRLYNEVLDFTAEIQKNLYIQQQLTQDYLNANTGLTNQNEKLLNQYDFVTNNLEARKISQSIWKRSSKAISLDGFVKSLEDAENYFNSFFWQTPKSFNFVILFNNLKDLIFGHYIYLIFLIILFILLFFLIKKILLFLKNYISSEKKFFSVNVVFNSVLEFLLVHYKLIFTWAFIYYSYIVFYNKNYGADSYFVTLFYLISIVISIYLSNKFIKIFKTVNQKLSYLFFSEKLQGKTILLFSSILYSTSVLIPLRQAFLSFYKSPSEFANVLLAIYTLFLIIIIFFFGKEDILTFIPSRGKIFYWFRGIIDKYYYPLFLFLVILLILINPSIGYYNLAWYLAFAIPLSLSILYGVFLIHSYIKKYTINFFIKEEDEEILDKFEHAKTYYGFFIIAVFLLLLFLGFILIARIWGYNYTVNSAWKALSQDWVLSFSSVNGPIKLGILHLLKLIMFIVFGYLFSSLSQKFILNKLFDIFRTDPGTQNSISRIIHYFTIVISILLGFASIDLGWFIFWAGGFLIVGIGLGLKDVLTDFVSGFFVLIERPIEIGNYVQIDEKTKGTVRKISARSTTIRTGQNHSVIIPNKDIVSKPIINWGQGKMSVGFEFNIIVDLKTDPVLVKKILLGIIDSHQLILKVPAPIIRLEDITTEGLSFFVRAFISSRRVRDQWDIASDLRFQIIKLFSENKIEISVPQRILSFANDTKGVSPKLIEIKFDQK